MIKIKCLASVALVFLNFLCLQTYSSQAADMREILLIQPDGVKKVVELNLEQSLSELRNVLIQKGVNILPDDKFLVEVSSQDEAQWSIREAISGDVLSFKPRRLRLQEKDEEIYQRFLNGALIYKPDPNSDVGMVTLPIRELENPLEGTFDLSRCGNAGRHLSISTGYRKRNKNDDKVEIWICPRFLIERELNTTAAHFKPIMGNWKPDAPIGLFWTNGWWDDLSWYDYLTSQSMDELSNDSLYGKWDWASGTRGCVEADMEEFVDYASEFICKLREGSVTQHQSRPPGGEWCCLM